MSVRTTSACPRCGELACIDPDSKGCSDNCIGRLQRELAAAQADARAIALKCAEIADSDWTTSGHGTQGERITAAILAYADTLDAARKP